jgi:hypothetical protein
MRSVLPHSLNRWQIKKPMAKCADNPRIPNRGFYVMMLVAMQEQLRVGARDVVAECHKTNVDFIIAVMNQPRSIMRHEDINRWKRRQEFFHFVLLKQVIPFGFVFPRTAKPAKQKPLNLKGGQVEVSNRWWKGRTGIVVALDCQNLLALTFLCDLEDYFIGHVTERHEKVRGARRNAFTNKLVVGNDEHFHQARRLTQSRREANRIGHRR